MPQIVFEVVSLAPKLSLMKGDYFHPPADISLPDISNNRSGEIGRVERLYDSFRRHAGDMLRTPTTEQVLGCGTGHQIGQSASRLQRSKGSGGTVHDVAVEVMDNPVDGFMVVYNSYVHAYARVVYTLSSMFELEADRAEYLDSEYKRLRGELLGQIRGYNAALLCAHGTIMTESFLDTAPFPPVIREGKVIGDFA